MTTKCYIFYIEDEIRTVYERKFTALRRLVKVKQDQNPKFGRIEHEGNFKDYGYIKVTQQGWVWEDLASVREVDFIK